MVETIVARTFGMDFIYFDLIFLSIWIFFLVKKKYFAPITWGLFGWLAYIVTDYIIWYLITETRQYTGPFNAFIFFLWFCFSPGFVQFSYVLVMFEKRNKHELIFWTLLFYIGWTLVSVGSQIIPFDDRIIEVSRDMNIQNQRLIEIILTLINLGIALLLYLKHKLRLEDVIYIFLIGTLVEMALEFTLSISGIRQEQETWSIALFIVNSLIEFNLGIVIMYLIFWVYKVKKYDKYYFPLGVKDLKFIKTDFDAVASICQSEKIDYKRITQYSKLYTEENFLSDLNYYCTKYGNKKLESELENQIKMSWN